MKLLFKIMLFFICTTQVISQTFKEDSIAVEAILDSNDSGIDIDNVIGVENGRVVILFLKLSMAVDIHVIPADIGKLTALKKLILLDFLALETLPPEIGNLKELDSLVIEECGLKELPNEIGDCNSLKYIHLNFNSITSIPSTIGNISTLQHLIIGSNNLSKIPSEIGNLSSIITLYIGGNNLDSLPSEIGALSSLKYLDCGRNNFTSFPNVCGISTLELLNLYDNSISQVPAEIGNLSSLVNLFIPANNLTTIPVEIGNLSSLKFLWLFYNNLTNLPPEIGNLSSLETIALHHNKLSSLPDNFTNLTSVVELFLEENELTTLPDSIGNLVSLKKAYLSNNALVTLPASIIQLNLPQGDSGINLCFNPDLVFTLEQQTWAGAKDYAEYEDKYCDVAIEEFVENESKYVCNGIYLLPGTIVYRVSISDHTKLEIFDILGKKVKTLFNGYKNKGKYSVSWEAERAGVYLIKLTSGNTSLIKKVTVTR